MPLTTPGLRSFRLRSVRPRTLRLPPALALLTLALLVGCGGAPAGDTTADAGLDRPGAGRGDAAAEDSRSRDAGASAASPAAGASDEPALTVRTVRVAPSRFDDIAQVTGELRADEQVELRAEDDGRVVALHFEEGQRVRRGELLVKINDADLQAERRRAEVQRQLAAQREQRLRTLLDEKTISQEVYDEAAGRLEVIDAEIELIDARIRRTEIKAPFGGVIGLRTVSEGSYLTSSQTVATLQRLDPIKIDFAVPEKYAAVLRAGAEVELAVAGRDETFTGRVFAVEPRVDAATRTVKVRAEAPNPERSLLPGAFAEVRLTLERVDDALMVPSIALIPGLEATTVFVVEDGRASPRQVRVGRRTAERVQILDGLEAGDEVILSGLQTVKPGTAVRSAPPSPAP